MNFENDDQTSIAKFVWSQLPRHKQFTLGTIDDEGKPWVVCLNLSFDNNLEVFWKSKKDTEHSKHITKNENVAICIFSEADSMGDYGLYLKAKAYEVDNEKEISYIINERYKDKEKPEIANFLGDSADRLYRATPYAAWVNDDRHIKTKVDLAVLRAVKD